MKKKFTPAIKGLYQALFKEKSTRVQFLFFFAGVLFGVLFQFNWLDWLLFGSASVLVIGFEMINTAIEEICNLIDREQNEKIKFIKDISAGAVLFASIYAAIVGAFLIYKHLC